MKEDSFISLFQLLEKELSILNVHIRDNDKNRIISDQSKKSVIKIESIL